ncbi:MAG: AAA family ATPase [Chloroflexi bacterium]|nr:AAA family ATPase [Chloroflexota bacterium]
MVEHNRDPWVDVRTRHGFPADELISTLQKEIRRGHTENAALVAYEMATTSPEMEAYLWKRLLIISVEDIGFGDVNAPILVRTLHEMTHELDRSAGERTMYAIHVVRYLCSRQKDRSSDEMLNWLMRVVESGERLPEVPEYALDMHTARGQKMGRGLKHFLETGAQVSPELKDREKVYHQRLLELVDKDEEK